MDATGWQETAGQDHAGMGREHGLQLQLLELLEEALSPGGEASRAPQLVEALLDQSDVHFGSEELMMRLHSFPSYGLHVEEHRRMVEALQEVRARLVQGSDALGLVRHVHRWVAGHIAGMDEGFARHLADTAGGH